MKQSSAIKNWSQATTHWTKTVETDHRSIQIYLNWPNVVQITQTPAKITSFLWIRYLSINFHKIPCPFRSESTTLLASFYPPQTKIQNLLKIENWSTLLLLRWTIQQMITELVCCFFFLIQYLHIRRHLVVWDFIDTGKFEFSSLFFHEKETRASDSDTNGTI